jgi:hypothetical protein
MKRELPIVDGHDHPALTVRPSTPARSVVRRGDLTTPLTYRGMARSWRGAYEEWMPTNDEQRPFVAT